MLAFTYLGIVIGVPTLLLSLWHYLTYQSLNYLAYAMIFFLVINTVICVWELVLFYCFDSIEAIHQKREKAGFYKMTPEGRKQRENEPIIVFKDLPLKTLLDPRTWAYVWIDYSRFDTSYVDTQSFGYNIDVGNGHSTFILSMILLYSIIQPVWSPQTLGIIGIVMYYQKWYGTIMYLFQFFNNKRYQKLSWPEILLCVLFSNGIWVVFPMIGFYASVTMIYSNSYAIYQ